MLQPTPDALLALLTRLARGEAVAADECAELLGIAAADLDDLMGVLVDYGVRRRRDGGLRIPGGLSLLDAGRIGALLAAELAAPPAVDVLGVVGSTNDIARAHIESGRTEARSILAEAQTAGRGRRGRSWSSPVAANIYVSHVDAIGGGLDDARGLSLVAGVAVAEAIDTATGVDVQLKWPNDLLVGERKLGGILVELILAGAGNAYGVLGIGINVRVPAHVGAAIDQPFIDLTEAVGSSIDRNALAAGVIVHLHRYAAAFRSRGFDEELQRRWQARDPFRDRRVVARSEQGELRGFARGIDASGALIIETSAGRVTVGAGDVSLRLEEGA